MATGSENYLTLVQQAFSGELKLPAFQRQFKWNRKQVVLLYDSIRQGYPLGSIILMDGSKEELVERDFRGANEKAAATETANLVLDGQQRLTAGIDLFYSQNDASASQYFIDLNKVERFLEEHNIDLDSEEDVEAALKSLDVDEGYCIGKPRTVDPNAKLISSHLLSTILLRPNNSKHLDSCLELYIDAHPSKKQLVQNVIKPYFVARNSPAIPYVAIDSKLQLDAISRIFATLNSSGKVLTPFELVVAVLFASNIDLRDDLDSIKSTSSYLAQMDPTGEICLQTAVFLEGGNFKKSLLPKNLNAGIWSRNKKLVAELLDDVGKFLTSFGMALDTTRRLIPYDTIFLPMAKVMQGVNYRNLNPAKKAEVNEKLKTWVVGAALSQRYNEGAHTKQGKDAAAVLNWVSADGDEFKPTWLQETGIPSLQSVTTRGAIANLLRCILNQETMRDPMSDEKVNFGVLGTDAHHIFPRKFAPKLLGWDDKRGDKVDLLLNMMQTTSSTNQRFLNDDPCIQVTDCENASNIESVENRYNSQGIDSDCVAILKKQSKNRDDYQKFISLREHYFINKLRMYGFENNKTQPIDDDLEDA